VVKGAFREERGALFYVSLVNQFIFFIIEIFYHLTHNIHRFSLFDSKTTKLSEVIMRSNRLPLCPCGSGKLYEECCYKKTGNDGQPLFFKGAITSNDGGISWHPIPNVALKAVIVGRDINPHRDRATGLLKGSKLGVKHHQQFIDLYANFHKAYVQLLDSIFTPRGTNVSFQIDTTEGRKLWADFLYHGRILLDFVGLHSRENLNLKRDIGGLNAKKFDLIVSTLGDLATYNAQYNEAKAQLQIIRQDIIDFIELRNREKITHDTILSFPAIDSQGNIVIEGKIRLGSKIFEMVSFVKKSLDFIDKLVSILLGKTPPFNTP
jgi:hypothetical protein